VNPAYLNKKLAYPLLIKGGAILRTIQDALGDQLLTLGRQRDLLHDWQHAWDLMVVEADVEVVTQQVSIRTYH
jgi:hypothetical protein